MKSAKQNLLLIILNGLILFFPLSGCSFEDSHTKSKGEAVDLDDGKPSTSDSVKHSEPEDTSGGKGSTSIIFGTHIGNPSMNLLEDAAPENKTLEIGDVWSVEKVQMNISTIMLKPSQSEMDKWKGPYLYDLLNNKGEPLIEAIEIKDGTYTKLEFQARPDAEGTSILIAGKVKIDGSGVPFEIRIKNNEKFTITSKEGLKIEADVPNHLAVSLDASVWFQNIDLSKASLEDDGSLKIENKKNKKIYQALRENIKMSSRIGVDKDQDGELEADEQVEAEAADDDAGE